MKNFQFFLLLMVCSFASYGQMDTIYSNNTKTACTVKEVTPDAVKFCYPNEDLVNSVYKNTIQKIVFKSGRVQTFAESSSFKKVAGLRDYDNVSTTEVESEIRGLYKLGDIDEKAKGTTVYSNQSRVKERAYKKLKEAAAMMGGNVIFIANQRSQGNQAGTQYQAGSTTETSLTGVVYTNTLPDFEEFKKLLTGKTKFVAVFKYKLWSGASDTSGENISWRFHLNAVNNDNGLIELKGILENEYQVQDFRVVSYSSDSFTIFYKDKSTAYNIVIKVLG